MVFGFKQHLVVPKEDGSIAHAQLSFGHGMIMLASVSDAQIEYSQLIKQPDEIADAETQSPYLIVLDADLIYQRAIRAGAKIELVIQDADYGGRGVSCRDLEGHLWSVGSYDPWQNQA